MEGDHEFGEGSYIEHLVRRRFATYNSRAEEVIHALTATREGLAFLQARR